MHYIYRAFNISFKPLSRTSPVKGSVTFVTLFAIYFNFLRPHDSLETSIPIVIPKLDDLTNMSARWIKLTQLSEEYISSCA